MSNNTTYSDPIADILNITSNVTNLTAVNFRITGDGFLRIVLYAIIFLLTIVGNVLVVVTLVQNKRMRTVTNLFLLNLAISDLLLGIFCIPVTLVGSILRHFVFGSTLCYLIPFFQGKLSVSVSVWTLVVISLERYFAICRPLHSRRWQTVSHAYRMIAATWVGSLITMIPTACFSKLTPTRYPGKYKCREEWPSIESERAFNIYLGVELLLIPLIIMTTTYALISKTLWIGIRVIKLYFTDPKYAEKNTKKQYFPDTKNVYDTQCNGVHSENNVTTINQLSRSKQSNNWLVRGSSVKNQEAKKRVVKMLFVVVVEFFICWTPLYIMHTWSLFDAKTVYLSIGSVGVSIIHLLSFCSCCCNPITYCFMHKKFRQGFLNAMRCTKRKRWQSARSSDYTATLNSIYSTRLGSIHAEILDQVEDDSV
ncbi:cholecystokinin receptor-like [Centruroides vittatus]|uniref:cholecystokinin receptor-like n=1 Tax=Centruroides vittatus TaxID=120091 RepID=UPI00350FDEFE